MIKYVKIMCPWGYILTRQPGQIIDNLKKCWPTVAFVFEVIGGADE